MCNALSTARYRVRQVVSGWRAWLMPHEIAEVRTLLSPAELTLFLRMQGRDQTHSFRVMRVIQRSAVMRGTTPSTALLVAALLHDVGKGRLATWHRAAYVLLESAAPRLARRLERPGGAGWRGALWRLRHHARLGAELLAAAETDARVIALVAGHANAPAADGDDDLARLIEADGQA